MFISVSTERESPERASDNRRGWKPTVMRPPKPNHSPEWATDYRRGWKPTVMRPPKPNHSPEWATDYRRGWKPIPTHLHIPPRAYAHRIVRRHFQGYGYMITITSIVGFTHACIRITPSGFTILLKDFYMSRRKKGNNRNYFCVSLRFLRDVILFQRREKALKRRPTTDVGGNPRSCIHKNQITALNGRPTIGVGGNPCLHICTFRRGLPPTV